MEYAKTSNLLAVSIYLLMLIGGQTAQIGMQSRFLICFSPGNEPNAEHLPGNLDRRACSKY
jgi:hypothetical protein